MHLASPATLLLFLPLVWGLWWAAVRWGPQRLPTAVLLLASLVFYGADRPDHLPVLLGSILGNHLLGRRLHSGGHRGWLWLGVAANLAVLGIFKYTGFAVGVLGDLGLTTLARPRFVLPLGLSFFTFQQLGFLVGCAAGRGGRPLLLDHALYVSFFPQLVAGPIVHHAPFHAQLRKPWVERATVSAGATGLALVGVGLFKKAVVADSLAPVVDTLFRVGAADALSAWTAALGYSLQLFYDFSGYADMAVGIGLLFGLRLPPNFDAPYRATSLRDFWRRWHMTLGAFLRDHVYVPLGGRRTGLGREWLALGATFLLGGLWHGAAWTFVLWGALHGALMVVGAGLRRRGLVLPRSLGWALTLLAVVWGWVLFRSTTIGQAGELWAAMLGARGLGDPADLPRLGSVVLLFGLTLALPVAWRQLPAALARRPRCVGLACGVLLLAGLIWSQRTDAFLYTRF